MFHQNVTPHVLKCILVVSDHYELAPNLAHNGVSCFLVGLLAKENDLVTR